MEHCLLFFEHPLLISHLRQQKVSYTVKRKGGLRKYHHRENVVAYVRSMEHVRYNDDFKQYAHCVHCAHVHEMRVMCILTRPMTS